MGSSDGKEQMGDRQLPREEVQREDEEGERQDQERKEEQEQEEQEEGWVMTDEELAALLNRHRVRNTRAGGREGGRGG